MNEEDSSMKSGRKVLSAVSESGNIDQSEHTTTNHYGTSSQIVAGLIVVLGLALAVAAWRSAPVVNAEEVSRLATTPTISIRNDNINTNSNAGTAAPAAVSPPSQPPPTAPAQMPPAPVPQNSSQPAINININNVNTNTNGAILSPVPVPADKPLKELSLELNQSAYNEGDKMSVTVRVPKEGYLYVMAIEADGRRTPLYPTSLVDSDAFTRAGAVLHLPEDLPHAADGKVVRWPMVLPNVSRSTAEVTESIVAFLSPTPRSFPTTGRLNDSTFRTRGPRPQTVELDTGVIDFKGLPQAAVHYQIRRKR